MNSYAHVIVWRCLSLVCAMGAENSFCSVSLRAREKKFEGMLFPRGFVACASSSDPSCETKSEISVVRFSNAEALRRFTSIHRSPLTCNDLLSRNLGKQHIYYQLKDLESSNRVTVHCWRHRCESHRVAKKLDSVTRLVCSFQGRNALHESHCKVSLFRTNTI